jgi:hypothetical protein
VEALYKRLGQLVHDAGLGPLSQVGVNDNPTPPW